MGFRPDINLAIVVFAASCAGHAPPPPALSPPANSPPATSATPDSTPRLEASALESGLATYYARQFAGRKTANGDRYDPSLLTAAHRTLPFGTVVEVRRADGRRVVVRINDRGPFGDANRVIDLSRRAAEELGIVHEGKVRVELRTIGSP